jgi:primosomal protein N' (replication factor Y)
MNEPVANRVVRVALPVPLPQLFDYLPPPDQSPVTPGVRVLVPFGRRQLVGIVVEADVASAMAPERLLPLAAVLDRGQPLLDDGLMGLLAWCWQYYKHAPGEVLQAALPPALRKAAGALPAAPRQFLECRGTAQTAEPSGRSAQGVLQRLADGPVTELG